MYEIKKFFHKEYTYMGKCQQSVYPDASNLNAFLCFSRINTNYSWLNHAEEVAANSSTFSLGKHNVLNTITHEEKKEPLFC